MILKIDEDDDDARCYLPRVKTSCNLNGALLIHCERKKTRDLCQCGAVPTDLRLLVNPLETARKLQKTLNTKYSSRIFKYMSERRG